jgi:hypothetical protein
MELAPDMASVWSLTNQPQVLVIVPEGGLEGSARCLSAAAATEPRVGAMGNVPRVPLARAKRVGEGSCAMCPHAGRQMAISALAMVPAVHQIPACVRLGGQARTATNQRVTLPARTEAVVLGVTLANALQPFPAVLALSPCVVGQPPRKERATKTECASPTASVPALTGGPVRCAMNQLAREKPRVHAPTKGSVYHRILVSAMLDTLEQIVSHIFVSSSTV